MARSASFCWGRVVAHTSYETQHQLQGAIKIGREIGLWTLCNVKGEVQVEGYCPYCTQLRMTVAEGTMEINPTIPVGLSLIAHNHQCLQAQRQLLNFEVY